MRLSLPYAEAGLSDEGAAAHALDRLGYGPRPGQAAEVAARGVEAWVAEQLGPPAPDPDLDRRLAAVDFLGRSAEDVVTTYPPPNYALRLAVARGDLPDGFTPRDAEIRDRLDAWMEQQGMRPLRQLRLDVVEAKLTRAVHSRAQLREVLADLWFNHFNVDGRGQAIAYVASYERDAIRPHVLGRFRDLLGATARHPAMLGYLDNVRSRASAGTPVAHGRAPREGGLNENYGRELLELHTLGVDGGYSQDDVVAVARAFTGWTETPTRGRPDAIARQRELIDRLDRRGVGLVRDGLFLFRPNWHDAEPKTVLGQTLPGGRGIEDGEDVLDLLSAHDATARHIAHTVAVRFVDDDPDPALVGRLADVFRRTDGDLRAVMTALVEDRAFWDAATSGPDGSPSKVKTPFEFVASAFRATATPAGGVRQVGRALRDMGEPVFHAEPPTGFPDHAAAWVNAGLLLTRMKLGLQLAAGRLRDVEPDLDALTGGQQPESVDAALATYVAALLPGRPTAPTVQLLQPIVREPAFARRVAEAAGQAEAATATTLDDDGAFDDAAPAPFDPDDTAAFVVGVVLGSPSFQRQ
ncbi:DUF1800 domain-containing protein [Rubrivirga sp.]|uniref:DUF1800 domain-containing protein n=1 Tax=Rubrivirga sp. TaxID=1885344 RepID=UPI003B51EC89